MNEIDKSEILAGSEQKIFHIALREMQENYTRETAAEFFDVYKDYSLSFVIEHAYDIIKEAYYGIDFISNIIKENIIWPLGLADLSREIKVIIKNAKEYRSPEEQIQKYEELDKLLDAKKTLMEGTIQAVNLGDCYELSNIAIVITDLLYSAQKMSNKTSFAFGIKLLDSLNNPTVFFPLSAMILSKYGEVVASDICAYTKKYYTPYSNDMSDVELANMLRSLKVMKLMSRDKYVWDAINTCGNVVLKNIWSQLMSTEVKDIDKMRCEDWRGTAMALAPVTTESAIESIMGSRDVFDLDRDARQIARYNNYSHKATILNYLIESAFESGSPDEVTEAYIQELCDTEAEMVAMEWEEDGEPNAVIKKHIMTKKEKEKEEEAKNKSKEDDKDEADGDNEAGDHDSESKNDDDSSEDESDGTPVTEENKKARKEVLELCKSTLEKEGEKAHISKGDDDKFISGADNSICLGGFGSKEKWNSLTKALKEATKDKVEFSITTDNYFTIYLSVKKSSDFFVEESSDAIFIIPNRFSTLYEAGEVSTTGDSNKETVNPDKPKEDFATKVQNKALDHDVKRREKKAKRDEKNTKLKNAGKTLAAGPKGWINSVDKFNQDFNKADENRRKAFFLKPGYRHRIFKNMSLALMYGGAAKAKLTLVPVLALFRHFSKDKDRRVRNELIRELDTEVKICEEKINDANSNGDQQEKYRLMRIKAKLESEKQRVQVNSKFI